MSAVGTPRAVHAERAEHLEVELEAGAARRIRACDRERDAHCGADGKIRASDAHPARAALPRPSRLLSGAGSARRQEAASRLDADA